MSVHKVEEETTIHSRRAPLQPSEDPPRGGVVSRAVPAIVLCLLRRQLGDVLQSRLVRRVRAPAIVVVAMHHPQHKPLHAYNP